MSPVLPANLSNRVTLLEKEKTKVEEGKQSFSSIPKIQKVQPYLRKRPDFSRYYSPKLVSIGPINFGDKDRTENLKQGEEYKRMWAAKYLETTKQTAQQLVQKIWDNLPMLKQLYTKDAIEGLYTEDMGGDEELAWIFLVDGCAVLYFMEKANVENPEALEMKVDQLVIVQQDLLLLENQLPYQLLKLLMTNDDVAKLDHCVNNFLKLHHMINDIVVTTVASGGGCSVKPGVTIITMDQPTHLLDVLRRAFLGNPHVERKPRDTGVLVTYRNIQDLKASGIKVTKIKDKSNASLTNITFDCLFPFRGRLQLSSLIVDDFTAPTFLNMIAYEMCPDFWNGYEISSYVAFLDSLIDHTDDVKEMRKAGVLHNVLGSDEEVAKIFNTIGADLVPDTETYVDVRRAIESHCSKKHVTWITQAYQDYFSTPWAFLGFAAAFIALFLTFVQTWFAIHPVPA